LKPLEGILVVTLEQAVAAPLCSLRLAEAGARVIKIERQEGDFARYYDKDVIGNSAYFVWLNRGKESLVADIKKESDLSLIKNIISRADVFIQNLAPGVSERVGLGSKSLRDSNRRLITCDISGYGQNGEYRDMKAYDLLVQAESGLCSVTGTPEQEGRVGVSVCDISCGMNAHASILQALYNREKTDTGSAIEVSLFDGMADWMNVPYLQTKYGGRSVKRVGLSHPTIAPYGAYESKCGKKILISIQNEREWEQLCTAVLKISGLAKDIRFNEPIKRVKNRKELDKIISDEFRKYEKNELVLRLRKEKIACGVLNSIEDLAQHPQLRKVRSKIGDSEVELIASPSIVLGKKEFITKVPDIGENSRNIREEFDGK